MDLVSPKKHKHRHHYHGAEIPLLGFIHHQRIHSHVSFDEDEDLPTEAVQVRAEIIRNLNNFDFSNVKLEEELGAIAISNDDKQAIVAGATSIYVYEIKTKNMLFSFENAHEQPITALAITANDEILVSSSIGGSIKLWDFKNKTPLQSFLHQDLSKILSMILVAHDAEIVVCSENNLAILSLKTGEIEHILRDAHDHQINMIEHLPNKNWILSVSSDRSFKIWEIGTWRLIHSFDQAHPSPLISIAVTNDERYAITTARDGSISVWDLSKTQHYFSFLNAHHSTIPAIKVSTDGRFIFCASLDHSLSVWDLKAKTHLHTFHDLAESALTGLAFTRDKGYLLAISKDSNIYFLNLQPKIKSHKFQQEKHLADIDGIKLTSDDRYLVSVGLDSSIKIWDFESRELVHTFTKKGNYELWCLDISPNNQIIASGSTDVSIDLWSIPERTHLCTFEKANRGEITCVKFSSNGSLLISCCTGSTICIWNVSNKKLLHRIEDAHYNWITSIAVTRNNSHFVSASYDASMKIWDLKTYECVYTFKHAHRGKIKTIKLTKNDKILVSASFDRTIKLWDFEARSVIHVFENYHKGRIYGISVSKDAKFMLAGDDQFTFAVYNLETKQYMYSFVTRARSAKYVAITSDSSWFVYTADNSIEAMQNPFTHLTVVSAFDFSPLSIFRFTPLSSYFLNYHTEYRKNLIVNYPDLRIFPHAWSWFHITTIFSPSKELINTCLDAHIPFEIDNFGKTPLHYLLKNNRMDSISLNNIVDKLPSILSAHPRPLELLDSLSDIVYKLIQLHSPKVTKFLKMCVMLPRVKDARSLEIFGELPPWQEITYYLANSRTLSDDIVKNLGIKQGRKKILVRILPFHWNYSSTSDDMHHIIKTLSRVEEQDIFETKAASVVIDYLWTRARYFHYTFAVLFSIYCTLISLYTVMREKSTALGIVIFAFSILFLLYEVFQAASSGLRDYLTRFWNYMDMFGVLIVPPSVIAVWAGAPQETQSWLFSFCLLYAYIRWVSYFRVFRHSRRTIRTVIEIIKDIRSFGIIMLFVIFGFSLIFFQFDKRVYPVHLMHSYNILYTAYDSSDYDTPGELFYFVIMTVFVSIVLLNMLIAIMGDTFARVQAESVLTDSQELLDLISEAMSEERAIKFLKHKFVKPRGDSQDYHAVRAQEDSDEEDGDDEEEHAQNHHGKKYLFFAEEEDEDVEEPVTKDEWQGQTDMLKKHIRHLTHQAAARNGERKLQTDLEQRIKNIERKVSSQNVGSGETPNTPASQKPAAEEEDTKNLNLEQRIERLEKQIANFSQYETKLESKLDSLYHLLLQSKK